MAIEVPKTIAPPKPCKNREAISIAEEGASAHAIDAIAKTHMPMMNTRFRPLISAIRPKGTRNAAAARRYDVATQPYSTVLIENSSDIDGSAIAIDDAMKGVRNELSMANASAAFLSITPTGPLAKRS